MLPIFLLFLLNISTISTEEFLVVLVGEDIIEENENCQWVKHNCGTQEMLE